MPSRAVVIASPASMMAGMRRAEAPLVLWSAAYFFLLLCGYYVLRPLREEMGIQGGVENLQWLFTATFVAMLVAVPAFGALVARVPRRRLLPAVYLFFIANILVFFVLFRAGVAQVWVARAFYVWVSVFNLFVVSVFWSFMADLFSAGQAKRLFGIIAAGGTAGAIAGPAITAGLVTTLGPVPLLLVSAGALGGALVCIARLNRLTRGDRTSAAEVSPGPTGGSIWAGATMVLRSRYLAGIALLILLYTTTATFLYFEQASIIAAALDDPAERTRLFAGIDLAVNVLTLLGQLLLTARLSLWLGVGVTLALVPALLALGFLAMGLAPVLPVLIVVQVLRRAGNFALMKPAREMLFTVLPREAKYKAKSFLDTVVYRGGDAVAGWVFAGLTGIGLGLGAIALVAVPLCGLWALVGVRLGTRFREREVSAGATAAAALEEIER